MKVLAKGPGEKNTGISFPKAPTSTNFISLV